MKLFAPRFHPACGFINRRSKHLNAARTAYLKRSAAPLFDTHSGAVRLFKTLRLITASFRHSLQRVLIQKKALSISAFCFFMIGFILSPRGGFVNRPQMEISRHSKNRAFIADSAAEFCFSRRKLPRGNTIFLTVSPVRGKIRGMVYQYANPYIVLRIFVIKGKCFRAYRS